MAKILKSKDLPLFNKVEIRQVRQGQPAPYADHEDVRTVIFDATPAYRHKNDEFLVKEALSRLGWENLRRGAEFGSFSAYIDYAKVTVMAGSCVASDITSFWRQYWVEVRMVVPSTE